MTYSVNDRAKKVVGLRDIPPPAIMLDFPCELGYHCPVCQYEPVTDGEYDERLSWSEYNGFIWCSACNKDYPSCLCMPQVDRAIDIYLDCMQAEVHCKVAEARIQELNNIPYSIDTNPYVNKRLVELNHEIEIRIKTTLPTN